MVIIVKKNPAFQLFNLVRLKKLSTFHLNNNSFNSFFFSKGKIYILCGIDFKSPSENRVEHFSLHYNDGKNMNWLTEYGVPKASIVLVFISLHSISDLLNFY